MLRVFEIDRIYEAFSYLMYAGEIFLFIILIESLVLVSVRGSFSYEVVAGIFVLHHELMIVIALRSSSRIYCC